MIGTTSTSASSLRAITSTTGAACPVVPLTTGFGAIVGAGDSNHGLDGVPAADVRRLYARHGVVLLRGFGADTRQFDRFACHFIDECVVNGNAARADVAPDRGIQTVNSGNSAIALHAEMAYGPFRPDVLCFHCMQPPAPKSGETLLCDGIELWRRLPSHLHDLFAQASIRYSMRRNRMIALQARGQAARLARDPRVRLFALHDDGTADLDFVTPAVEPVRCGAGRAFANSVIVEAESASFEGGGAIDAAVRQELFVVSNALAHRLAWESGDVLIVDNSRIMHGRRKIVANDGRKIALKMGWEGPLWQ